MDCYSHTRKLLRRRTLKRSVRFQRQVFKMGFHSFCNYCSGCQLNLHFFGSIWALVVLDDWARYNNFNSFSHPIVILVLPRYWQLADPQTVRLLCVKIRRAKEVANFSVGSNPAEFARDRSQILRRGLPLWTVGVCWLWQRFAKVGRNYFAANTEWLHAHLQPDCCNLDFKSQQLEQTDPWLPQT